MSATQEQINRLNNNVQTTLNTIAETGVEVGTNSNALPAAAAALANEKQNKILKVNITLSASASAWAEGDEGYTQTISVTGGTASSLVALQPTISQMLALQTDGVAALVVDNNNGVFVAKSLAAAPSADITMQATLTEES